MNPKHDTNIVNKKHFKLNDITNNWFPPPPLVCNKNPEFQHGGVQKNFHSESKRLMWPQKLTYTNPDKWALLLKQRSVGKKLHGARFWSPPFWFAGDSSRRAIWRHDPTQLRTHACMQKKKKKKRRDKGTEKKNFGARCVSGCLSM